MAWNYGPGAFGPGGAWLCARRRSLAAQELTVSAAASLTNAFPEIGKRFEKQHPGSQGHLQFCRLRPLAPTNRSRRPGGRLCFGGSKDHEPGPREGAHRPGQPEKFCEQYPGAHRAPGLQAHPDRPSRPDLSPRSKGWRWAIPSVCRWGAIPRKPWQRRGCGRNCAQVYSRGIGAPGSGLRQPGRGGGGLGLLPPMPPLPEGR